jgi:hypothetical protein
VFGAIARDVTVWAEATLGLDQGKMMRSLPRQWSVDERIAAPPPAVNPDFVESEPVPLTPAEPVTTTPVAPVTLKGAYLAATIDAPYHHGHFLDVVFGMFMTIVAVASTFILEVASAVISGVVHGFHRAAELCQAERQGRSFLLPLNKVIQLVCSILLCVDAILRFGSRLVTEVLAPTTSLLTTCFGGRRRGAEWNHYLRRLCHLTQSAFRGALHEGTPEACFPPLPHIPGHGREQQHRNGANRKGKKGTVANRKGKKGTVAAH